MPCAAVHAGTGAESICILISMFSAPKADEKKSFGESAILPRCISPLVRG